MPEPLMLADFTPAPASNSRQPPADSRLVTSTLSALKLTRVARSPATVWKLPLPLRSILISRSLPFCTAIGLTPSSWVRRRHRHAHEKSGRSGDGCHGSRAGPGLARTAPPRRAPGPASSPRLPARRSPHPPPVLPPETPPPH